MIDEPRRIEQKEPVVVDFVPGKKNTIASFKVRIKEGRESSYVHTISLFERDGKVAAHCSRLCGQRGTIYPEPCDAIRLADKVVACIAKFFESEVDALREFVAKDGDIQALADEKGGAKMTDEEKLHRTAIHKAGHTVCAMVMGISFMSVSIEPTENTEGRIVCNQMYDPALRDNAMAAAIYSLGGCVAETLQGYDVQIAVEDAKNDIDDADDILRIAFKGKEFLRRRVRAFAKTQRILRRPINMALVEAIAAALVEKRNLTFEEVATIAEEYTQQIHDR
jgi:hypothetical protein